LARAVCAFLTGACPNRNEVNRDVNINGLLLFVFAFVAGYLVALCQERIALRRERKESDISTRSSREFQI
jgi:hypothetical protein